MFPYNEIPLNKISTAKDIYKFGHQSLLRALNIGRVVAFSGSGASYLFDQPTWHALKTTAFDLLCRFERSSFIIRHRKYGTTAFAKAYEAEIAPLIKDIEELLPNNSLEAPEFIHLCEEAFRKIDSLAVQHGLLGDRIIGSPQEKVTPANPYEFRREMAKAFLSQETQDPETADALNARRKSLLADPDLSALSEGQIEKLLPHLQPKEQTKGSARALRQSRATLHKLDLTVENIWSSDDYKAHLEGQQLRPHQDLDVLDTSRALFKLLGIRRFITLNYDLEIERMLAEESRSAPSSAFESFVAFLNDPLGETPSHDEKLVRKPGHPVTIQSGSGRVLRSTASRQDSLADLFAFGAFPTNFNATVHHLHGRVDDPENMILTTLDYQRIYYDTTSRKRSFDEARHAVFTGSDILLYGIGHSEADVLRPFREFIQQEPDRRDFFGKVYYLTSASLKDATNATEAYETARKNALALTQKLYQQNGFFTIFTNFLLAELTDWPVRTKSIFAASAEISTYANCIRAIRKSDMSSTAEHVKVRAQPQDPTAAPLTDDQIQQMAMSDERVEQEAMAELEEIAANISNRIWAVPEGEDQFSFDESASGLLGRLESKLARWALEQTAQKLKTHDGGIAGCFKAVEELEKFVSGLEQRVRNLSSVSTVENLNLEQDDWWEKWSKLPGLRWAIFGPHQYEITQAKPFSIKLQNTEQPRLTVDAPMVWRQTNLICYMGNAVLAFGDKAKTPLITDLLDKTRQAALRSHETPPEHYRAAVARVSMPPGAGKGRLNAFLHQKQRLDVTSLDHAIMRFPGRRTAGTPLECYPFQLLFPRPNETRKTAISYVASFSVHLTFNLEFTSIIFGTLRFLMGFLRDSLRPDQITDAVAKAKYEDLINYQFQHARTDRRLGLEMLDTVFDLLVIASKIFKGRRRVVISISYLDRLVDDQGIAGSPIHRYFFRIISSLHDPARHADLPIDWIFVNSDATRPVRYLSEELPLGQFKTDGLKGLGNDEGWMLSPRHEVAVKHWDELASTSPPEMYREAVRHSLMLSRDRFRNNEGALVGYPFEGSEEAETDKILLLMGVSEKSENHSVRREVDIFAKRRVFNGFCVGGLAQEIWQSVINDPHIKDRENAFRDLWDPACRRLTKGFVANKTVGFFSELIETYRLFDRDYAVSVAAEKKTGLLNRNLENPASSNLERLSSLVVNHLALFNHPVSAAVIKSCPEIRELDLAFNPKPGEVATPEIVDEKVDQILMDLVRRGLASRYKKYLFINRHIEHPYDEATQEVAAIDTYAFALDPKVGLAVRSEMRMSVYGYESVVPFQVTLYASQAKNGVKPEPEHFFMVQRIIRNLVTNTHTELVNWKWSNKLQADVFKLNTLSDKLRAAYALIRGTFSISVISALNGADQSYEVSQPFEEYRSWTRELLNASIQLSQISRKLTDIYGQHFQDAGVDQCLPINQPFFRDEVTWLYNERAMVSFVQGRLFDAQPLFEKALEIAEGSRSPSEPISYRATQRRIQLNQSLVHLERGHIKTAKTQLEQIADRTAQRRRSDIQSTTHLFASGYLALCHHLSDDFKKADAQYRRVIQNLRDADEPRGLSIFLRHHADLLRATCRSADNDQYEHALSTLTESEQIAESIGSMDLQIYTLIARARLDRDMKKRPKALKNLRYAEKYAHAMGNQKILTDVFKVRGEVLFADGEATQAGFVSAQAVSMAKRNGMRLRKISAVIVQAKIMNLRGQKEDAEHLVHEALIEAKAFGYATKSSEATRLLTQFSEA